MAVALARNTTAALVYGAGLLQGLTLVSFPASSSVLQHAHGFSAAQYGAIFLPQVALAIAGALAGAALAQRVGLKTLLLACLAANALSQLALAASLDLAPAAAYQVILLGTACLGLGFGLSGAPLNGLPPLLFRSRGDAALVAMHSTIGIGLALGPLLMGWAVAAGHWGWLPLGLVLLAAALVAAAAAAIPRQAGETLDRSMDEAPAALADVLIAAWPFALIAVLYAFAEGTFANWAVIYLHEGRGIAEMIASLALSVFWGALVAGRLLSTLLLLWLHAPTLWLSLPPLMIAAFWLLPNVHDGRSSILLFALAGLACSAFFPLTVAIASRRHATHAAAVASLLTAALMLGVGFGSTLIGLLRQMLDWDSLYRLAALFPLLALLLAATLLTGRRHLHERQHPG